MAEEVVLMKGNEAIAHAAIRCGADGYATNFTHFVHFDAVDSR